MTKPELDKRPHRVPTAHFLWASATSPDQSRKEASGSYTQDSTSSLHHVRSDSFSEVGEKSPQVGPAQPHPGCVPQDPELSRPRRAGRVGSPPETSCSGAKPRPVEMNLGLYLRSIHPDRGHLATAATYSQTLGIGRRVTPAPYAACREGGRSQERFTAAALQRGGAPGGPRLTAAVGGRPADRRPRRRVAAAVLAAEGGSE
ncbi:hypothetical protein LEMLEM_LOCUS5587 [Lemmus lemmus]